MSMTFQWRILVRIINCGLAHFLRPSSIFAVQSYSAWWMATT